MPRIQGYEDHVVAQGAIQAQAGPDDFGAGVGRGIEKLGSAVGDLGDRFYKMREAQDVSNVHVNFAKARADWTQKLAERERNAIPGDDTFAESLMKDMDEAFAQGVEDAKTPRGREVYQSLASKLVSEFGQRAVFIQSELSARDAVNKYGALVDALGNTVRTDPAQLDAAVAQGHTAIDDPSGMFSKVDQAARDKFKAQLKDDANLAAGQWYAENRPAELLDSLAPEKLAEFKPWEQLLNAAAVPGGRVQVGPETSAKAPQVIAAASAKNLLPNVLLAMQDVTPGSTPEAQASDLQTLADRYGGSYQKAITAFYVGTDAFDALLKRYEGLWAENLPVWAKVKVDEVMTKAGLVPSEGQPADAPGDGQPATSSLKFFSELPWKTQDALLKTSVQTLNAQISLAARVRAEQEHQKEVQQETRLNELVQKVYDPKGYGSISQKEILADPLLDYRQKEHILNLKDARIRELKANAESATNPGNFRALVMKIHADPTDPNKIRSVDQLIQVYGTGAINFNEFNQLQTELKRVTDGGTSTFAQRVQAMREAARTGFMQTIQGKIRPEASVAAYYKFTFDLEDKIAAKLKNGEDPSVLLDPASREFALKPEALAGFMGTPQETLAAGAAAEIQGAAALMKEGTVSASGKFVWKGGKWVAK